MKENKLKPCGWLVLVLGLIWVVGLPGCAGSEGEEASVLLEKLSWEDVAWVEFSPAMGLTTYVEEPKAVSGLYELWEESETRLHPLEPEDAEAARSTPLDPDRLTVAQTAYPRNIRIDFMGYGEGEDASRELVSIHLYGNLVTVGEENYQSEPALVDELLVLLDEIHQQGWGLRAKDLQS